MMLSMMFRRQRAAIADLLTENGEMFGLDMVRANPKVREAMKWDPGLFVALEDFHKILIEVLG